MLHDPFLFHITTNIIALSMLRLFGLVHREEAEFTEILRSLQELLSHVVNEGAKEDVAWKSEVFLRAK
jgi:hypothetical protein